MVMLKFLQIASIVCEKAKKNEKIREYFPCLFWRAHSSIQICSLLLALLRADNHTHNDRRAELLFVMFSCECGTTMTQER